MYRFSETVEIDAPPSRVWRALCDPAEVVQWDTGVAGAIDAPADYPQPGQHVRWRYTNGPFRTLHDRPEEVVADRTLRSLISVGPIRVDETYTLEPTDDGCRLTASLTVDVSIPLLGGVLAQRWAGPATRSAVAASMRAIKRHCESAR